MSSNSTVPLGIHGDPKYINFQFRTTYTFYLLFVPILYIPATVVVVYRIFAKLMSAIQEKTVNVQLFSAITLCHFMCLLFFVCDLFYIRIPIAGLLTSWCASLPPSGYLVILIILTYHVNYVVTLLPFLVAIIRLILILMPQRHQKVNSILLKWALPIIFLYPFLFTFGMFPAIGYCQATGWPVPEGGVIFRVEYNGFGIRNALGLIFNTFVWLLVSLIINVILIVKLIKLKFTLSQHVKSQMSHKAEISLTFTSLSMAFSYVTNGMIAVGHGGSRISEALEPWSLGALEHLSFGALEPLSLGASDPSIGFLNSWILEFLNSWILEFLDSLILGFLDFCIIGLLDSWILGFLDSWILGFLDSLILGFLVSKFSIFQLGSVLFIDYSVLLIVLRPFMNDLDTCFVPWVFYLTHPIFKAKSVSPVLVSSRFHT